MKNINQYIYEQLSKLKDQRRDILIKRLAYLKYADETKGNNKFKDLYDLLFNFLFDEYGSVRDNKNLYNYIEKLIQDNNGTIPGLPNNGTIETIDKKINALDEIEPSTLKKYIKEVEKEALSREKSGKKSDTGSFENEMKDSELKEKINNIINTEGFTNILGLESSQKMSALDKDKIKEKEDNIKKNIPNEDDEEEDSGEENTEGTEDTENDPIDDNIEEFIRTGKMKKPEEDLSDAFLESYNDTDIFNYITEKESQEEEHKETRRERRRKEKEEAQRVNDEAREQNMKETLTALNYLVNTREGKEKEKASAYLDHYKKVMYDEDGHIRSYKDATKYYRKHSIEGGNKLGFEILTGYAQDANTRILWSKENPKAWKQSEKQTHNFINTQEKDYVQNVTDVDGSIIRPRKKMNGNGITFVRVKNGHEIGYATREEYLAAKRRKLEKSRIKKESIELISLVNYICS